MGFYALSKHLFGWFEAQWTKPDLKISETRGPQETKKNPIKIPLYKATKLVARAVKPGYILSWTS